MQQYISKSKTSSWDGPIDELAESILSPDRLQQSIIFYSALTALIIMMITITSLLVVGEPLIWESGVEPLKRVLRACSKHSWTRLEFKHNHAAAHTACCAPTSALCSSLRGALVSALSL